MNDKRILIKPLRLERCLKAYKENPSQKQEVYSKFRNVWGETIASHFLSKYEDAESLIWALDADNLHLFITKF